MFVLSHIDSHLWIRINKSVTNQTKDLFICLCCIVPSNSSRNNFVENNIFDVIQDNILSIKDKYGDENCSFMLLGDLNSRVGNIKDYV